MKAYPAYKDSGNGWIKNIPEHWSVLSLKRFSSLINGSTPQSATNEYWDGDIVWVTPTDLGGLNGKVISNSARKITEVGLNNCGASLTPKGSIILSTRAPIGHLALTDVQSCTNQGCKTIVPDLSRINNVYLYYYLFVFKEILQSLGQGSTFVELSSQNLKDFASVFPPLPEQQSIADFLDRKTAQIDALIEKKQRQIELLQEQRTALINHAVTKGLNPNAKMKNSGVEWLGEIPSHWELKRLGWITSVIMDIDHKMPLAVEEGVPFLSAKDLLNDGTLNFENDVKKISEEDFRQLSRKVQPKRNDIIYSRIGARLGKARLVETDQKFLVSYSCCVVRVLEELAYPEYICFIMDSEILLTEAKARTVGIGVPDLGLGEIAKFPIPLPPKPEQENILAYLKKKDAKIKSGIKDISNQIALLQEYRTTLISEAVTGKIDVRTAE